MGTSPPPRKRTLLAWSSGKDSAWTLHQLLRSPEIEVAGLFTTVAEDSGRVGEVAERDGFVYADVLSCAAC